MEPINVNEFEAVRDKLHNTEIKGQQIIDNSAIAKTDQSTRDIDIAVIKGLLKEAYNQLKND